jgi:hypothetical protein
MIFSLVILFLVSRFGRARSTRSDFYIGDRAFTAPQNGLALAGTSMMTSFLALSNDIALRGYDGVLLAAGFAVSWLVTLLLVAEPLRNTGRYTLGDALSVRMRQRPVRVAAATITLVVVFIYMSIQLVSAGSLVALLVNLPGRPGPGHRHGRRPYRHDRPLRRYAGDDLDPDNQRCPAFRHRGHARERAARSLSVQRVHVAQRRGDEGRT